MRSSSRTKSLNFKLWTYFMIFAAIIMLLLWLLQIVFINSYYEKMKINEISRIGNELVSIYGTEDFEQQLLVNNAINYSLHDKRIMISVTGKEELVEFRIKDFGQGIPDEEKDFIWDRYYRGGKSNTRKRAGSGIGLSLVKSIILAHDGQVGVESQFGEGSLFYFKVPRNLNE
ncbi:MAG: sensor histidine kinase [Bacillota bacterium]